MKQLHKKQITKKNNPFLTVFGTFSILILIVLAFVSISNVNSSLFGGNTKKTEMITTVDENGNTIQEEIVVENNTPDTVTVLLVGRGGLGNDAPELTDTIIIAKLNKVTKDISLLSIPRDLFVVYKKPNGAKRQSKINAIYANSLAGAGTEEEAMKVLIKKAEEITGEHIDYFANVDFTGFTELIDTIGGIEIDVPKRLVDNEYPTKNWGYETIVFEKGLQTMSGEDALKYARSRHSTSDYDRSLRQQLVIQGIKNKIASTYLLTSPDKIVDLYNVFNKNIFTNVTPADAVKLVLGIDIFKDDFRFYSSNIHDGCFPGAIKCEKGGIVYPQSQEIFGGQAVSLFDDATPSSISTYDLSQRYAKLSLNYPRIVDENYKINIVNATNRTGITYDFINPVRRYGFFVDRSDFAIGAPEPIQKSVIYYHGISPESQTIQALGKLFSGEIQEVEALQFPNLKKTQQTNTIQQEAQIEIVIGNDYIQDTSIFNF